MTDFLQLQESISKLQILVWQALARSSKGSQPGAGNVFVYKPGIAAPVGNYMFGTNLAGTQQDPRMDTAIAQSNGPAIVFSDDSLRVGGAPFGPPAVPWRPAGVANIELQAGQLLNTTVGRPAGLITCSAPLPGVFSLREITSFVYSGAPAFFAPPAGSAAGFYIAHSTVETTGAGYLLDMTAATPLAPSGLSVFMADSVVAAGSHFYKWNANVTIASSVELWEYSSLAPNCLAGPVGQIVLEQDAFSRSFSTQQSLITGGVPLLNPIVQPNVAGASWTWGLDDEPPLIDFAKTSFVAPDGAPHLVASIPIQPGTANGGNDLVIKVSASLGAGGYMAGQFRLTAQNHGGVITDPGISVDYLNDVTGTGWSFVVAVVGTNVNVTTSTAAGAVSTVRVDNTEALV